MPFSRPPAPALIKWAALFRVLSSHPTKKPSGLMPKQRKLTKERQQRPATRAAGGAKSAGAWFRKLVELQARLRAPEGCPWDIEQTHLSLRTYLIEEAYEVLEALESGDDAKFAEELGADQGRGAAQEGVREGKRSRFSPEGSRFIARWHTAHAAGGDGRLSVDPPRLPYWI